MKVPLLDLKPHLAPLRKEILEAVTRVVDSTCYILGDEVEGLEAEIARYCGTMSGIGVSSGTDALLVSLMALGIGQGDQVLTTPYTFFATMGSILRVGARPVFADIDPQDYNIDPVAMEEILEQDRRQGRKIRAIMVVHLFGQCARMDRIMELARTYDLPVIEDAAQAIGAEFPEVENGRTTWYRAGSMGICGCFSFFPSKNLGGIGDGGMVVTGDPGFEELLRCLRNHGAKPKYHHRLTGGNFRLDPIQAAVLRVKLPRLETWHSRRRENRERYNRLFADAGLLDDPVVTPQAVYEQADGADSHNYHIFNQYVIRVPRRDELRAYLQDAGIGCEVYYPVCLHRQPCLPAGRYRDLSCPVAEKAARETLALPIYPELSEAQQAYVVEKIQTFYASR